jgi:hypothetical protein
MAAPAVTKIFDKVTTNAVQTPVRMTHTPSLFQGVVSGTGAVTATILIEGSLNGVHWTTIGTITLTDTTVDVDKVATVERWAFVRATTSNVTGTGATVSLYCSGD